MVSKSPIENVPAIISTRIIIMIFFGFFFLFSFSFTPRKLGRDCRIFYAKQAVLRVVQASVMESEMLMNAAYLRNMKIKKQQFELTGRLLVFFVFFVFFFVVFGFFFWDQTQPV